MSAYEELDRTGGCGEQTIALLRTLAAQVTRGSSFPPSKEYDRWSDEAVDDFLALMFEKKGPQFVISCFVQASDDSSLERLLIAAIRNHQVVFADCDFTFDLVAALPVAVSEDVLIANRDEQRWERSNTRTLKRLIAERNVATGGVFVHQVWMVKELKAQYSELETICGLVVESLTYLAVTRKLTAPDAMPRRCGSRQPQCSGRSSTRPASMTWHLTGAGSSGRRSPRCLRPPRTAPTRPYAFSVPAMSLRLSMRGGRCSARSSRQHRSRARRKRCVASLLAA